ncbi:MAG TPA: hypothetical protein VH637_11030 [Streptosporangiaceae bacterium]|jgi:hypothetical protein
MPVHRSIIRGRLRPALAVPALAAALAAGGLAGCQAVSAVKKAGQDVARNKATIDTFAAQLKTSVSSTFVATYVTTGSPPSTIVYATRPPGQIAFSDTRQGGGPAAARLHLVVNAGGAFSCQPPSADRPRWSCRKLASVRNATGNAILAYYTQAHWLAFLKGISLAAGLAGDVVSTSKHTVHGFAMNCLDFHVPAIPGSSRICTTSQGVLGYVKVAPNAAGFELTAYSTSPPASLFRLPPGATVTTPGR